MKKLIAFTIALTAAVGFVGCGKGSDSGGTANTGITCPVNSTWNGQVCVNNGGTVTPGTTQIRYYDYISYFQIDYWTKVPTAYQPNQKKSMRIVNSTVYKKFLKEAMAVCDRTIWGGNYGYAKCDNWTSGSMILQIDLDSSLKPAIYFTAIPAPQWFSLNIGIDSGAAAFNPLALAQNTTYNLINQSKGFEIRSNGSSWNGGGLHLIQIQVLNGTTADANVNYTVYYPNSDGIATAFLTGTLTRY